MPVVLVLVAGIGLFFLLQDQKLGNETINNKVVELLQNAAGDRFEIGIGETGFTIKSSTLLALSADDVTVTDRKTGKMVAELGRVNAGFNPMSLLSGSMSFNRFVVDGGTLDASAFMTGGKPFTHIDKLLADLRAGAAALEQPFSDGRIGGVEFRNFYVSGLRLGRRADEPVSIETGKLAKTIGGDLTLEVSGLTDRSDFKLDGRLVRDTENGRVLDVSAGPFNALEWVRSPATGQNTPNGIGSDSELSFDLSLPLDDGNAAGAPTIGISIGEGNLRIGRRYNTRIDGAELHVRLFPDRNQIELEKSSIVAGDVNMFLLGGVRPFDAAAGYGGDAELELIVDPISAGLLMGGGGFAEASGKAHGFWRKEEKTIRFDEIMLATTKGGNMSGDADIILGGKAPAIRLDMNGSNLAAVEVEKLWPFFLGARAKHWVSKNVQGGSVEKAAIRVNIPAGRLNEYRPANGPNADEVVISADLKNASFRTVGDLPAIEAASGSVKLEGTRLYVDIGSSPLSGYAPGKMEMNSATLQIDDTSSMDAIGSGSVSISGSAASLARIADTKPLQVSRTISLDPATVSGSANAEIAFRFHPRKKEGRKQLLGWNALIDLAKAGSTKPLFGRKISGADLFVESTPEVVRVKGEATVDGFPVQLSLIEPATGAAKVKRARTITTSVDHDILAKNGITVAPVVTGKMDVEITSKDGSPDHYKIDLKNADISLPWIGWTKGSKIPATAEFTLTKSDGTSKLNDFTLKGNDFSAAGSLEFTKSGLSKANFSKATLFGNDSFSVAVGRKGQRYIVNVNGKLYDARSVIRTVLHGDKFANEKAETDVTLTGNFGTLVGFGKQAMRNVVLTYSTADGLIDRLVLKGATPRGGTASVNAKRNGNVTEFDFRSDDAGSLLAMADYYSKLRGGKLRSKLVRKGSGPFTGNLKLDDFSIVGEEKLAALTAAPAANQDKNLQRVSGELKTLDTRKVQFDDARAHIVKGPGYLEIGKGRLRNSQIGMTFEGMLFDQKNQMNLRGTFMPAFAVSRLVGLIPIVGDIFSNGKDSGLIGITYRLKGPFKSPGITVNPMSIVAPGVFRKAFEFTD